jgi:type I restriction-modification system DNA methylase subunit
MCELNKKNVLICNQIFDINNQYKLNIYEGDSLKLNYNEQFGIEQFDIIVGNPPYQDNSGNKGKCHTLWTKFVEL